MRETVLLFSFALNDNSTGGNNGKAFAKAFYNSSAWKEVREFILK